jgi:hypothetical protein
MSADSGNVATKLLPVSVVTVCDADADAQFGVAPALPPAAPAPPFAAAIVGSVAVLNVGWQPALPFTPRPLVLSTTVALAMPLAPVCPPVL